MTPVARLCLVLAVVVPASANAHKSSDSYLRLTVVEKTISAQWSIALRDLEHAIGLDDDGDRTITWGELHRRQDAIAAYALPQIRLSSEHGPCDAGAVQHLVDHHTDGAYAVLRFKLACPGTVGRVDVSYRFLFDLDAQHRGLVRLDSEQSQQTAVFSPDRVVQSFPVGGQSLWRSFMQYILEGMWHIWIGYDHVLFLLALLLPSVLVRIDRRWHGIDDIREAAWDTAAVVTMFTIAHSITLGLATFGWVALPSRWVESAIALSVIVAATNNLFPVFHRYRPPLALVFGLIHGLGFAAVLNDLGLSAGTRFNALLGFNIGVELGQLAIVAIFLPLAFWLRATWFYRRVLLVSGSSAVALLAGLWLYQRLFDGVVPVPAI